MMDDDDDDNDDNDDLLLVNNDRCRFQSICVVFMSASRTRRY